MLSMSTQLGLGMECCSDSQALHKVFFTKSWGSRKYLSVVVRDRAHSNLASSP